MAEQDGRLEPQGLRLPVRVTTATAPGPGTAPSYCEALVVGDTRFHSRREKSWSDDPVVRERLVS